MDDEKEIWDVLHRHLDSIFTGDSSTYAETTSDDSRCTSGGHASRQTARFHRFMIDNRWSGAGDNGVILVGETLQRYAATMQPALPSSATPLC